MSLFYKTVSLNHVYPTTLTADPTNIYTPTQLSWLESYCGHPYDCSQKVKWAVYEQGIIEPVNQHLLQLLNSDPPKMDSDTIIKVIPLMISVAPNLFAIEKKRLIHYLSTIHDQALISVLFSNALDVLKNCVGPDSQEELMAMIGQANNSYRTYFSSSHITQEALNCQNKRPIECCDLYRLFGNFNASDKDLGFYNQFELIGLFTLMVIQRMKSFRVIQNHIHSQTKQRLEKSPINLVLDLLLKWFCLPFNKSR
tara:strand:- start:1262 stop:2023 length:762 start_codon:yes stop_codon:yes gene_type:complete